MSQEQQILVGLAVGIIVLIWMIIKTKILVYQMTIKGFALAGKSIAERLE